MPFYYAANILDPKFIGTNLTIEEQISRSEYIHQLPEVVESVSVWKIPLELVKYLMSKSFFFFKIIWY